MKKFTKILSVLCALALLVSVISVGFVTNAAGATMTVNAEPTSDDYATRFGDNWLTTSSFVSTESVDGVTGTPSHGGSAIMVDNLWSTGRCMYQSGNGMNADNNEAGQTDTYFQTTFTLAAPINDPETALIAWGNANSGDKESYESLHYEIFASDNESDLYTKSVYEHNVTSKVGWEHVIDISDKALKGVKYFGIRIYNRPTGLWNSIVVVTEIGLYGGKSILTDSATYSDDENNAYNYGANRLAGSTATTTGMDNGAAWEISKGADVAILTDGSTASRNQIQAAGWDNSYSFSKASTSKYIQVEFALSNPVNNPEKFLIAHDMAAYESNPTVNQWYEIFASNKQEDLYSKSIFVYKNASAKKPEQQLDLSGMNLGEVKYFAIRFYHTPTGVFALPSEIALYGGVCALTVNSSLTSDENGSYDSVYGKNNLTGSTITYNIVETDNPTINGSHYPTANIIDGSTNTLDQIQISSAVGSASDYTQKSEYMDVMFELPAPINNPQKFLIAYRNATGESSMHYAIYASSSKDTLFSNELYEYSSVSNNGQENIIDLSSKKLTNITHFAIRFYNLPVWGTCVLPREIALFGGKTILTDSATYSDDENNAYNYGANKLAGSSATTTTTLTDSSGAVVSVSHNADVGVLTDGSTASRNQIQVSGIWNNNYSFSNASTDKYIQVTFALGGALNNPEKFLIAHDQASLESNPTVNQWYEIFASDTEADLYENSLFVYKNTSAKMVEQQIDLSDMDLGTVKYFGIRFYYVPTGCFALPSEIALYGGKLAFQANGEPTGDDYEARFGANHLTNGTFTTTAYIGGSTTACSSTFGSQLTDNLWSTGRVMAQTADNAFNADNNSQGQKNAYYEVTFTLNSAVNNPETVLLAWENTVSNANEPNKTYESQHYEIFASSDLASLYNNSVYEHENYSELGREHVIDISGKNLTNIKYFGVRFYHRPLWNNIVIATEIGLYTPPKAIDVSIDLAASVFSNTAPGSGDANDIQYRLDLSAANKFEVIDAGLISGFKVNIDSDMASNTSYSGDYAEYLKTSANGSVIAKTSIPADMIGSNEIYFHHTNSGTHNGKDYSGYKVCSIGYVVIKDGEGTEYTIYSNLIDKSSMQISRNQAKAYKEKGYNIAEYAAYDFANDGNIDIAVVRNYVKAAAEIALFEEVSNIKIVNDGVLNSNVKTQGRAYILSNSLGIDNSAAGFEFNAYCAGDVSITVNCNGENSLDDRGPKFVVVVDGETTYDVAPSAVSGDAEIVLATGLEKANHSFAVYRMTPSKCDAKTINLKGKLIAAPEAKDLKIAFVGDSITVGHYSVINAAMTNGQTITDWDGSKIASTKVVVYDSSDNVVGTYNRSNVQFANNNIYVEDAGAGIDLTYSRSTYSFQYKFYDANGTFLGEYAKNQTDGTTYSNSYDTYAVKTAKALNADWDVLGMSGNKIENVVSANNIFTTTYRGTSAYDLKADIFVINMATNSMYSGSNATAYGNAMATAVTQIRAKNPDAKIVFAYGSMRNDDVTKYYDSTWTAGTYSITEHHENIRNKATSLNTTYGDIYSFGFSRAMREGGAAHPSMAEQGVMAQELAAFINTIK